MIEAGDRPCLAGRSSIILVFNQIITTASLITLIQL